jgi:hypothetical protein
MCTLDNTVASVEAYGQICTVRTVLVLLTAEIIPIMQQHHRKNILLYKNSLSYFIIRENRYLCYIF